jgi:scyllo-inositol 2-dehydrogenase (NADP+)
VSTVVTGNPERQAAATRAYPDATIASSAEEVFESAAGHDFVVVAAPNEVHVTLARKALDAGLPVVVDKPFAPTADEARSLVEQAEQLGVPITAYMNRRWDSDQLTLRRLLEERRLGKVLRYESRLERWHPVLSEPRPWSETSLPEAGGGILLDLGCHLVDQALVLFGGPGPRLRVLGDRAAYVVTDVDGQEDALVSGARPNGDWGTEPREKWGHLISEQGSEPIPSESGDCPRFYSQLERALRQGSSPPVDSRDAVAGLEILDAARRSAATGAVVSLR